MNFGRKALLGLILNNQHESEIFKVRNINKVCFCMMWKLVLFISFFPRTPRQMHSDFMKNAYTAFDEHSIDICKELAKINAEESEAVKATMQPNIS